MNRLEKEISSSPKEPFGLNAFGIETLNVNGVRACLVSCEHLPGRIPKEVPWEAIEEEIERSSLVFVEYFPEELESRVYHDPILGAYAHWSGEKRGINKFFNHVTELCKKHDKEIAVADIANNLRYVFCLCAMRFGGIVPQVLGGDIEKIFATTWFSHGMLVNTFNIVESGPFYPERYRAEKLFFDIEDARRLLTAKGIWQETQRRKSDAQITYIAPRAHVSRVGWHLENPHDCLSSAKAKAYSAIATVFGLSDSTRIYKYSSHFDSWQLVSNIKTQA